MRKKLLNKQRNKINKDLLLFVLVLTLIGLFAVADASAPQALNTFSDKYYFLKQQAIAAAVGLVAMFIISNINYKIWSKLAVPFFIFSLALLVLVLIPGIGSKFLGARRWIFLGSVSIQPSEFVKLSLAVYLAKVAEKEKRTLAFFLPALLVFGLIMLEPDLGTSVVILAMGMIQIFLSGINFFHFLIASLIVSFGGFILTITSAYRRSRITTFFKPLQDPLGSGYHIRQILFALGSGGFWGVGLGQSRQKYLFLPEAATDSIFAVMAEEVGFIGSLVIIFIFAMFIFKGLRVAKNAPDRFSQILAAGIVSWIGVQVILNIGANVALLPLTGIPLPFFSYGGSALVMLLVGSGILLNISKYEKR